MKVRHIDWYPDEWLAGTYELGNAERGLYITVCSLIYSSGGPIRERLLYARSAPETDTHRHYARVFKRLLGRLLDLGKIYRTDDGLIGQRRCETELRRAEQRMRQQRAIDAPVARHDRANLAPIVQKSANEDNELASTNYQLPTTNLLDTSNDVSSSPRKRGGRVAKVYDLEFEAWWQWVPRKAGKDAALAKYRLARRKASAEDLLAGIKRYAEQREGQDPQYTAHPATWLHQGRWLDGDLRPTSEMSSGPKGPPPTPEELWGPNWAEGLEWPKKAASLN